MSSLAEVFGIMYPGQRSAA